ncbi:MAG TPA: SDR family NAD(P)-dependent oxidoreductase [Polyangiaceae bacterium]|nr:SDR family NAD(P)-dependent oxidoreductase [Polyangiaceae bacterium]
MLESMDFRGRSVLVTGASAGLGREIAKLLAIRYGAHVLAVARRVDRLEQLRDEVETAGGRMRVLGADLSNAADVERVIVECSKGDPLYGAVLSAAVTHFGNYEDLEWSAFETMLRTNVTSTVRLATELLPRLERSNAGGGLLIVASMAGLSPVPYQAAYAGTKAFLVNFSASLWHELRGRNVSITTYAPGGIATEMTAGQRFELLRRWLMPADQAALEGIEAFRQRKYIHVPGAMNRIGGVLMKMLPGRLVGAQLARAYKRSLDAALSAEGATRR